MPDSRSEFGEAFSERICARKGHENCPHLFGAGGGFNPRRLRPEFGIGLCACSCHSSCPVKTSAKRMTVPLTTWYQSCTCPGAEQERRSLRESGLDPESGGVWEQAKRNSRLQHEAMQATRDRAAGKSPEEIREMYVAELRSRGLPVPSDPALDAAVDAITGSTLHAVRMLGKTLVDMGKGLYRLWSMIR